MRAQGVLAARPAGHARESQAEAIVSRVDARGADE
jgi:hypothetical protein